MNVKIKPKVINASTKNELISKITRLAGHKASKVYPLLTEDRTQVVLYSLQKHNKKVVVNKRKKKIETSQGKSFQRDVISPKHWVAYVYFVPKSLVNKYEQKTRTFTVSFK